eukprot:1125223-Prorocentrum_minimum.AAC.1
MGPKCARVSLLDSGSSPRKTCSAGRPDGGVMCDCPFTLSDRIGPPQAPESTAKKAFDFNSTGD